ncbi:MAG: hypothetical protein ACQEWM_12920 [Actinomycetota bacterium]
MRRAPRCATVAAALIVGAALAGCGAPAEPPVVVVTPPEPLVSHAPVAVAEPAGTGPLAPPRAVPEPPAPTAHYRPAERPAPPAPPAPQPPSPTPSSSSPSPSPSPSTPATPSPPPAPVRLDDLLIAAGDLPQLRWADDAGDRTARWTEVEPATMIARGNALPHVAAGRWAGGACASAADAVDRRAVDAAIVSLAADPAPGAPIDVVLLRYRSPGAAAAAVDAVQELGVACEGIETPDGTFGSTSPRLSAAALLIGDDAALTAEVTGQGAMLVAVVHEGAPPEAIDALVAAQLARLG